MELFHPMIGITPQYDPETERAWIRTSYTDAVSLAGGLPVILDQTAETETLMALCTRLDGILLTGGADIHPKYYGETIDPFCGTITEIRDHFEQTLLTAAAQTGIPLLGICRGIQAMTVFSGGSLYQHIDGHSGTQHCVSIAQDSRLYSIIRIPEITVNSHHHQSVRDCAPGMCVSARAADGTIEAVEAYGEPFFVGVQWHPELMQAAHACRLFSAFICAARAYHAEHLQQSQKETLP